jgi:hypothetical protein
MSKKGANGSRFATDGGFHGSGNMPKTENKRSTKSMPLAPSRRAVVVLGSAVTAVALTAGTAGAAPSSTTDRSAVPPVATAGLRPATPIGPAASASVPTAVITPPAGILASATSVTFSGGVTAPPRGPTGSGTGGYSNIPGSDNSNTMGTTYGSPSLVLGAQDQTLSGLLDQSNANSSPDSQLSQSFGAASSALSTTITSNSSAGPDGQLSQKLGGSSSCITGPPPGGGPPGSQWTKGSTSGSSVGIMPSHGQEVSDDGQSGGAPTTPPNPNAGGTGSAPQGGSPSTDVPLTNGAVNTTDPRSADPATGSPSVAPFAGVIGFNSLTFEVALLIAGAALSAGEVAASAVAGAAIGYFIGSHRTNEPSPDDNGSATGPRAASLAIVHLKHGITTDPGPDDPGNTSGADVRHYSYNTNPGPDDCSASSPAPRPVKMNVDP